MDTNNALSCDMLLMELKKTHLTYVQMQTNMLKALKDKYGDEAMKIAQEVFTKESIKPYLNAFDQTEDRSVENLIEILWKPLAAKGFQFTTHKVENGIRINCTQCPWVMLYGAAQNKEMGFDMVCHADAGFVEAFNDKIQFTRTKTLMQGDNCCDHTYILKT